MRTTKMGLASLFGCVVVMACASAVGQAVAEIHGVPTLVLDGEPYMTPVFETYRPEARFFQQFGEAGCDVHMFSISLGPPRDTVGGGRASPMWLGPNDWDFSELDERAAAVLEGDPDGLLMPRLYVDPPNWWLAGNVSECMVLDTGRNYYVEPSNNAVTKNQLFVSLASEKWRRDMVHGIRGVIEHIDQTSYGERVVGYMVTGLYTEEWYHWSSGANQLGDYSEPFRRGFQRWLRAKYGDEEGLRAAWNAAGLSFEDVRVPDRAARMSDSGGLRSVPTDMPVVDFYLYYNELVPETIEHFCRIVKETTGPEIWVGAFYGFMFEFRGDPEYGHNALGRYLNSPWMDYIAVTSSYYNRQLGRGADYRRSPSMSVLLHDKVWFCDNDTLSFRWPQVMGLERAETTERAAAIRREAQRLGAPNTLEESLWQYRRHAGFTLGNGMYQSFFDLHGGYFDDPGLMAEVAQLNRVFEASAERDRSPVAEILVVSSEESCSYASYGSELMTRLLLDPQVALSQIGAPHDSILVDDLALADMARYRLVIFLNVLALDDAQRALIKERVLGGNRVVYWAYAPGYFNGAAQRVEGVAEMTGMHMRMGPPEKEALQIGLVETDHRLSTALAGVDASVLGKNVSTARLFYVDDPQAAVLGTRPGSQESTLAAKELPDWTSVYGIAAELPAAFYRALAKHAGVHLYNDRDDTVYVSASYFCISANGEGPRMLRFPRGVNIFDAASGEALYLDVREVPLDLRDKETLLWRYE